MKDIKEMTKIRDEVMNSISVSQRDLTKDYTDLNILRKAYELILENSDLFFTELEKSFRIERESREFNPLI